MTLRRTAFAILAVLLLVPLTSCNVAAFDTDGDGTVTRQEFVDALIDFFCGEDEEEPTTPDDGGTPDNGPPDDGGTPDDGTPDDGTIPQ
jgi:hypothetical protein